MERLIVTIAIVALSESFAYGQAAIDYSKTVEASEVASYFFGPGKPSRILKPKINVGRIGISARTSLNCGRLDAIGSVSGELSNLEGQLKEMTGQVKGMFSNPSALAMAVICYYKPQVCAYIRHGSLMFNEQLALNFDACQSLDNFIGTQADKGMKQIQATAVQDCITSKSGGGKITTQMIRKCQKSDGKMRNLLKPYTEVYSSRKQKVLKSIVSVVNEDQEYPLLVKLLGEVEVRKNGHWVKLFPEDQLKPGDLTNNFLAAGEERLCDSRKLTGILNGTARNPTDPFGKEVRKVIKEKIPLAVVRDLKTVPDKDRKQACVAISEGIAEIAVKRSNSKNKSVIAAALANDALPDDLRLFYKERSEITFAAVQAKIDAEEIKPLDQVLLNLRTLASQFRMKNRESASGVSAGKLLNESQSTVSDCEDEMSCER